MKRICGLVVSVAFLCVMLFSLVGQAEEKTALDFAKWAPERPAGVVVIDLQALKIKAEYSKFKVYVKEFLPRTLTGPNELTAALAQFESGLDVFESQIDKFSAVGAAKAYLFIDSRDYDNPSSIILVIPTDAAKSNQAQKLAAEFVKGDFIPESGRAEWQKAFFVKAYEDCIVLAPNLKNDDLDAERQKQFFEELELRNSALSNKPFQIWFSKASSWKTGEIQIYLFPEGELAKVLEKADRALASEGVAPNTIIKGIRAAAIELDFAKSDFRLQIISEDDQSANELYSAMPVVKRAVLNRKDASMDSIEMRLMFSDLFNHSLHLFNPVVKYNTLNWSSKTVFKRLDDLLPKITIDRSAGLYAPVTDSVKEEADRIYSLAAPFINKQTFAVIHLDTVDLDGAFEKAGAKVYDELKRLLPGTFNAKLENITQAVNYVQMVLEDIDTLCHQINVVGGRDLFVIIDNDTAAPVKLIVPFDKEKKADAKKLFYFLRQMRFLSPNFVEEQESLYFRTIYKNCLVFGIKNSNLPVSKDDFNNSLKGFEAQDVPEIRQAFEISWSYQRADKNSIALSRFQAILNVQALLKAINAPVLQLLREQLEDDGPELAKLLPAFTDQQLADGVKTAVLEIHPEKLFVNLHVISKDEQSARDFAQFVKALKPLVGQSFLKGAPEDTPAIARDLTLDYVDSIFDSHILEVRDNVLSIRSNNVSEKYKKMNAWCSENRSMTAVGVSGVAVGLLLPAVAAARESARRMQNANNFKQLALGMLMYEAAHRSLPSPYTVNEDGKRLHSWRVALLPYFEELELYDQIRLDEPWDSDWNKQFHDKCPKVFQNPSVELAPGETTFAVVVGENTAFPGNKRVSLATITDGCSNTAMIVERSPVCWMDPNSDIPLEEAIKGVNVSPNGIRSYYNGIFMLVLCDGSVCNLPDNVSSVFLRKLFERNDGKIIELDDPELNEE
ncbi:MAG: DUF1559 domain-containing protein [Thermoguttaceae bacterium]|nr:DUF1559 domain-containing protein [Thermoguttaceae bacterium]